ncbi:MAG: branched-chain amino acid ABC transporter permease [Mucispirillum sp.]|uniref:Branched-chain amino acid ABC transporter permease n=1 Tax=Candidatus Mucispirillum faecigallinarum TaxID=2838699 RepID=A0A9D2GQW9_9BACT|nr:branched-chain amino acid ABC transporter permease [Mucispirillum sp.]HIZ88318.1 branched-chain amino acid ABC transporter permease [Candidatus Mucispirillum faecigallinarum]
MYGIDIVQILIFSGINIITVLGLNLITGVTGQLSLGHSAFFSIGAYTSALLMLMLGIPFWAALILAALMAGLIGGLFSVPILRLRGDYLAIATLGFCEIVRVVLINLKVDINGRTKFLSTSLSDIPRETTLILVLVLVVLAVLFMAAVERSKFGLALRSIREDEVASQMMGINIASHKILSFAIGSAFAGLGGALYASYITVISPGDFGFMRSIEMLCMLVLGGMGSIVGVIAGTVVLTSIPEILREIQDYRMIMYGIVLILMMVFRPRGLFGKIRVNV